MIQLYDYDEFTFSIAILFALFGLIGFIGILWYNILQRGDIWVSSGNTNNYSDETGVRCISQPTNIPGNKKYY